MPVPLPLPSHQDDSELLTALMERIRDDDMNAFDELFRRFRGRLECFLHRRISDRDSAEDLAQQTFLRILWARHRYEPTAKFTTWAFTIANNLAKNEQRRLANRRELLVPHPNSLEPTDSGSTVIEPCLAEDTIMQRELVNRVRSRMSQLPARQRAALELFAIKQEPMATIGVTLQCSGNAVKGLLSRARDEMRRALPELANSTT